MVVVMPNVHLHNSSRVLDTKVGEEEALLLSLSMEVVEGMVVEGTNAVEWLCSSRMEGLLSTTKAGPLSRSHEEEHLLRAAVAGEVAVELYLLLLDPLGHQFPSCTKQPSLCNKLG